jgi:hypothetical protein
VASQQAAYTLLQEKSKKMMLLSDDNMPTTIDSVPSSNHPSCADKHTAILDACMVRAEVADREPHAAVGLWKVEFNVTHASVKQVNALLVSIDAPKVKHSAMQNSQNCQQ